MHKIEVIPAFDMFQYKCYLESYFISNMIVTIKYDQFSLDDRNELWQLLFLSTWSEGQLSSFNKSFFPIDRDPEGLHSIMQAIGGLVELGRPFSKSA